jgi:hypothetical protein
MANFPITLLDAIGQAELSWLRVGGGDFDAIASELDAELTRPGSRASVVQWFIDGRYATSGSNVPAATLINGSKQEEIDAAFAHILHFVQNVGDAGEPVAEKLRSMKRDLLNNYRV